MIVITGPGRSGTSFLADLYRKLKFDPGGAWDKKIRAGYEAHDVVDLNSRISNDLQAPIGPPPRPSIGQQRWDRVQELAEKYGDEIREVAGRYEVAKDPRFAWTLRVWFEAGAPVEHVILTLRRVDDVISSSMHAGMGKKKENVDEENQARTVVIHRIGSLITALGDYQVPFTTLWFPHYLKDPDRLYESLVFPRPVERDRFLKTFSKLADPDLVHRA